MLGLFLKHDVPKGLSAKETVERIHEQDGIAISAHPYMTLLVLQYAFKNNPAYDAIEALNGMALKTMNDEALRYASITHKPVTAGSDAHYTGQIGKTYTLINTEKNESLIKNAIIKGETRLINNGASPLNIARMMYHRILNKP